MVKSIRTSIISIFIAMVFCTNSYASGINVSTHAAHGWDAGQIMTSTDQMDSNWIRDEIRWVDVERSKGNFSLPDYAGWVDKAVRKGIKPLCILGFGNGIYQENGDSYTSLCLPTKDTKTGTAASKEMTYWNAWMSYVKLVVTNYKGKIKAYEIWNEPDHSNFNNNIDAGNYAKLYIETRKLIKSIDPNAIVICGAVAGADHNFINGVLNYIKNNGGVSQIDAFSLHFYVPGSTPEELYKSNLSKTYLATFLLKGYTGPIWMTENGCYTGTAQNAVSESEQASFAIRFPVIFDSFLKSVNTTGENFWYDLRNDGTSLNNSEDNYGLTYNDYKPKASYKAAATFNRVTKGLAFKSLNINGDEYIAEYSDGADKHTYIAWTTSDKSKTVSINIKGDISTVYSIEGRQIDSFDETGIKNFKITSEPIMIQSVAGTTTLGSGTVINYNSENKRITVSGELKYFKSSQDISFLVVPHGTEINNGLNPAIIGYLGTITTDSKNFSHSFALPEWFCGETDIYVAGLGIKDNYKDSESIPENEYVYVASIDADKSSMGANAMFRNFTSEEKEANIIVAGYKNNKMIDMRMEVIKIPAKTYQSTEFTTLGFELNEEADVVKAFVWTNSSEMTPLIANINK